MCPGKYSVFCAQPGYVTVRLIGLVVTAVEGVTHRPQIGHITLAVLTRVLPLLFNREEVVSCWSGIYRPQTVDRIRAGWIGSEIEQYVVWLAEQGYSSRSVLHRVPLLIGFGEFGRARGARRVEELPAHVEAFVADGMAGRPVTRQGGRETAREVRGPVEQMLTLVVPRFVGRGRSHRGEPFADALPEFFEHVTVERGLRPRTLGNYQYHLSRFEAYLARIGVARLSELSPQVLSAFIAEPTGRRWSGPARSSWRM
jgi:integrase/recombinase XerD